MSSYLEAFTSHSVVRKATSIATTAFGWVQGNLWPVYSTGIVVATVCLLAASVEKQMLADHYYGESAGSIKAKNGSAAASKLLDDEASASVKQSVWHLPKQKFEEEYSESLSQGGSFFSFRR